MYAPRAPMTPNLLKVKAPQKNALANQNKGHLGSRCYISPTYPAFKRHQCTNSNPVGAFASTVLPWVDETTTFPGAAPVVMMIRIGILWPHEVLVEQGKKTDVMDSCCFQVGG